MGQDGGKLSTTKPYQGLYIDEQSRNQIMRVYREGFTDQVRKYMMGHLEKRFNLVIIGQL